MEMCLNVVSRYIHWIEVSFVISPAFINRLYYFLCSDYSDKVMSIEIRINSAQCISEILYKKMPVEKKSAIIAEIGVIDLLEQFKSTSDPSFAECLTEICIAVSSCCIDSFDSKLDDPDFLLTLSRILQLLLFFLGQPNYDVSGDVLSSVQEFTTKILRFSGQGKIDQDFVDRLIVQLVQIILPLSRIPSWYNFETGGDPEVKFDNFRSALSNFLLSILESNAATAGPIVFQYLSSGLASSSIEKENSLFILYTVTTARSLGNALLSKDGVFSCIFESLFT